MHGFQTARERQFAELLKLLGASDQDILVLEIDLGDARQAPAYARATVRIKRGKDSVTVAGAPILYGISRPVGAPHPEWGGRFIAFLLSVDGRAILRRFNVDALDRPEPVGGRLPAGIAGSLPPRQ